MKQTAKNNRQPRKSSRIVTVILVLVMIAGVGIMLYPTFSNWYNGLHQSRAIADYNETVSENDDSRNEEMWDAAIAYNEELAKTGTNFALSQYNAEYADGEVSEAADNTEESGAHGDVADTDDSSEPDSNDVNGNAEVSGNPGSSGNDAESSLAAARRQYQETLDVSGTGIMGYINIDKVNIHLPIYHDTSEGVLQIAVGHIAGTSLPVGGESSHSVLTGHTGLPSAKLFTDIDQLEIGDTFQLVVLDHVLTYEVSDIRVVLPNELDSLQIVQGEDLCTLVTCTPYGINTHRLLVTGKRVPTPETGNNDTTTTPEPSADWQRQHSLVVLRESIPMIVGIAAVVCVVLLITRHLYRKKNRVSHDEEEGQQK